MINVQTFIRLAKHLTNDIPNPQILETRCPLSQRRRHAAHAQTPTLRWAKFQKLLLIHYRRKCRHHRRCQQISCRPFGREDTLPTLTLRKSTDFDLHPFCQTCESTNVNESAIGIKFGLPFRLLKVVADIGIVLQTSRDFFGGRTGNLAQRCVGQMNFTEFFEAFGGETVRPKTAATSCESFQSIGVILV